MENVSLWHERDISHSSVERIIVPDSTMVLHYITAKFRGIMEGLQVYPENMLVNLERTGGLIFSERVLLALVGKGLTREEAYEVVQRSAMRTWRERVDFKGLLEQDPAVTQLLTPEELGACFDMQEHLRNQHVIFERLEQLDL
jgi:adenylosuccinate lyase